MVRYADDFVVLCRSSQAAAAALAVVQQWTAQQDNTQLAAIPAQRPSIPESETIAAAALIAVNRELRRVVSGGF